MVDDGIDFTATDLEGRKAMRRFVSTLRINANATKLFDCKLISTIKIIN